MILSSLVCGLLAYGQQSHPYLQSFVSPLMGNRENASNKTSFAYDLLAPWAATSPTYNQGTSSPHGHKEERVIQSEMALTWIWHRCHKDYRNQIGRSLENHTWHRVKQHKAHIYARTFKKIVFILVISKKKKKKTLNNLSTKFVRFSTSFLSKGFSINFPNNKTR